MRKSNPRATQTLLLANPAFEDALLAELRQAKGKGQALAPGVIACPHDAISDFCFARQVLPAAHFVQADGPSAFCDAALSTLAVDEAQALYAGRALVSVFAPDFFRKGSGPVANHPLEPMVATVRDILEKKLVGRAKKYEISQEPGPPRCHFQILMTGTNEGWTSLTPIASAQSALLSWPSPFPAGRATVPERWEAPSSAYKKVEEAFAWLHRTPDDSDVVLDLGAAPGGWTCAALAYGARVIAFDRADMAPALVAHPRLTHLRKDAFEHAPLLEATWLLCDVIDLPYKSLDLISRALEAPNLLGLVVTIKLKRPVDAGVLRDARTLCAQAIGFEGRAKNLCHNKCEITVMMHRTPRISPEV